jgi:hypothetical protein
MLQKAVVKQELLGCEGGTKPCSGCEDHSSVEAGWQARIEDLGAPAIGYGSRSRKDPSGVGINALMN